MPSFTTKNRLIITPNVKKRFKSENSYIKICRFKIKALPLPLSKNWLKAPYGRVEAVKGHIYIKT